MSKIEPAVAALTDAFTTLLGPPAGENMYLRWWTVGEFEVALQREVGPHVWISERWRPTGGVLAGLEIEHYPADRTRLSSLKGNCPTLCHGNAARCMKNVGTKVQTVVKAVRACAVSAGAIKE